MLDKEILQLNSDISIAIEVLNARQLRITFDDKILSIGKILNTLIQNDCIEVTVNKQKFHYKLFLLTKLNSNSLLLSTNYPTKTKHFLLPLLGFNKQTFQVDTYLEDVRLGKDLDKIYLTYRYFKGEVFNNMESFLKKHANYLHFYDVDTEHVVYEFSINPEQMETVKLFTKGRYSQFPVKYKEFILKFFELTQDGETYKILYKEESRRKQLELELLSEIPIHLDLWDIPDMEKEIQDSI